MKCLKNIGTLLFMGILMEMVISIIEILLVGSKDIFKLLDTFSFLNSINNYFRGIGIESYGVTKYDISNIYQLRSIKIESLTKIYNLFYTGVDYTYLTIKEEIFKDSIKYNR